MFVVDEIYKCKIVTNIKTPFKIRYPRTWVL